MEEKMSVGGAVQQEQAGRAWAGARAGPAAHVLVFAFSLAVHVPLLVVSIYVGAEGVAVLGRHAWPEPPPPAPAPLTGPALLLAAGLLALLVSAPAAILAILSDSGTGANINRVRALVSAHAGALGLVMVLCVAALCVSPSPGGSAEMAGELRGAMRRYRHDADVRRRLHELHQLGTCCGGDASPDYHHFANRTFDTCAECHRHLLEAGGAPAGSGDERLAGFCYRPSAPARPQPRHQRPVYAVPHSCCPRAYAGNCPSLDCHGPGGVGDAGERLAGCHRYLTARRGDVAHRVNIVSAIAIAFEALVFAAALNYILRLKTHKYTLHPDGLAPLT